MRTAWVEVNLFALKENLKKLRNCTSAGTDIMAVIKADAYGHGALKVAHLYRDEGISRFAVALIQEGIELRENGINEQILIIGPILEDEISELIRYNLTPTISTYYQAKKLNDIVALHDKNKKLNIHIEIDTGMGRLGFIVNGETAPDIVKISQLPNISIEGIYTHLATADRLKDLAYVEMQYEKFMTVLQQIEDAGVYIPLKHMCNSAATINFPKMHLDMVRPGTALYGLYPGSEMAVNPKVELIPAMSIKAKLVFIKSVPIGTKVSYSGTFETKRPTVIGVVPMGYVDGVSRQLSNKGNVLLHGRRCQIIGNICMDQFMIDITDINNPQIGDEVVFLGRQGKELIAAEEIALLLNTVSVEIVTRLGKRMPIIYKDLNIISSV